MAIADHAYLLASGSPQRRALFARLGLTHRIVVPGVDELEAGEAEHVARTNALRKLDAVSAQARAGECVVAVDTLVARGNAIYGKPCDEAAAAAVLTRLRGTTHTVVSGLAVSGLWGDDAAQRRTAVARTDVTFRAFTDSELDWYLASGEWTARAGGYAIQGRGAILVDHIAGDYENVVGFPLTAFLELMAA